MEDGLRKQRSILRHGISRVVERRSDRQFPAWHKSADYRETYYAEMRKGALQMFLHLGRHYLAPPLNRSQGKEMMDGCARYNNTADGSRSCRGVTC